MLAIGKFYKIKMKRILWLSNIAFSEEKIRETGTWQIAMAEALLKTGEIELYNITNGDVKCIIKKDVCGVKQWIIPNEKKSKNYLPSKKTKQLIQNIENEINPDLVHIWGTENYWGMLAVQGLIKSKVLLEIQGLLFACSKVFYGGLTITEIFSCIGLKELLLPKRFLYFRKMDFEKRGFREIQIIKGIKHISIQSDWARANIKNENPTANIFDTGILLRKEFYQSKQWTFQNSNKKIIFTTLSGANTYKGLHVLIRSVSILKQNNLNIELRIGSNMLERNYPIYDGYIIWMLKLIKKLDISNSIVWLGPLNSNEIVHEIQNASVFVIPSYVETYCLAFAEAMMVGIPTVVSYAGALPELALDGQSALFFPVGDSVSCASKIQQLLENKLLSETISNNSRKIAFERNDQNRVVKKQIEIYNSICN